MFRNPKFGNFNNLYLDMNQAKNIQNENDDMVNLFFHFNNNEVFINISKKISLDEAIKIFIKNYV